MSEKPESKTKLTLKKKVNSAHKQQLSGGIQVEIRRRRGVIPNQNNPNQTSGHKPTDTESVKQKRVEILRKQNALKQALSKTLETNRTIVEQKTKIIQEETIQKNKLDAEVIKRQQIKKQTETKNKEKQAEKKNTTDPTHKKTADSTKNEVKKNLPNLLKRKKVFKSPRTTFKSNLQNTGRKVSVYQILQENDKEFDIKRGASIAALKRRREKDKKHKTGIYQKISHHITIPNTISIIELASQLSERVDKIIKILQKLDVKAGKDEKIDGDTAELVVQELGHTSIRIRERNVFDLSELTSKADDKFLVPRASIVAVLGHVDHGKTTLLDTLRNTQVTQTEFGGITQHIGAYRVFLKNKQFITFLDTPGHAAFTAMRLRGASITDIALLIIAADDGVQPQTVEAINHIKASNTPLIVVITKIDTPGANPDKILQSLMQYNIIVEKYQGEIQAVEISAKEGKNMDKLLDTIALQSEIMELKANPKNTGTGVILESKLDAQKGITASVLIKDGTIKQGDSFLSGLTYGRIRQMIDENGKTIKSAEPSMPVSILGFQSLPKAGDDFIIFKKQKEAENVAKERIAFLQNKSLLEKQATTPNFDFSETDKKIINVIIKSDVQGSLDAIKQGLQTLDNDEVELNIIHLGVGSISESDIDLASTTKSIILAFNVQTPSKIKKYAERLLVSIQNFTIIYDLIENVRLYLSNYLTPEEAETELGQAEVREVFNIKGGIGTVAGSYITDGIVKRNIHVKVFRNSTLVHTGTIASLRSFKENVAEVSKGHECGISISNFNDIHKGDTLEFFEVKNVKREIQTHE